MMKYENNSDQLREMFQKTFGDIEATDAMRDKLKTSVKNNIKSENRKFKSAYKIIAAAACFLLIICIVNFDSIKAGVMNVYEYFFSSVEEQYDEVTKDYVVDIHKKIKLEDDLTAEITQAIFINDGIDLKIKICEDTGKYDLVGCEIKYKNNNRICQLQQEMFARLNDCYISSLVFLEKKDNWKNVLGNEISFDINILYMENDSDASVSEKNVAVKLTPKKIFIAKYSDSKQKEIYNDGFIKIQSIELKGWYMKINYNIIYKYDEDKGIPFISVFSGKNELLPLSSEGPGVSEVNNNGDVTTTTEPACVYFQLPKSVSDDFKIKSVYYEYGNAITDVTALTDGKDVYINWKTKED